MLNKFKEQLLSDGHTNDDEFIFKPALSIENNPLVTFTKESSIFIENLFVDTIDSDDIEFIDKKNRIFKLINFGLETIQFVYDKYIEQNASRNAYDYALEHQEDLSVENHKEELLEDIRTILAENNYVTDNDIETDPHFLNIKKLDFEPSDFVVNHICLNLDTDEIICQGSNDEYFKITSIDDVEEYKLNNLYLQLKQKLNY